jgi:SPP1 gp7 family putative phage head morphogenesis protein
MFDEYAKELTTTVAEVKPITEDETPQEKLKRTLRRLEERFAKLFGEEAPEIAEKYVKQVDNASAVSATQSLKQTSATVTLSSMKVAPGVKATVAAATKKNVALIKSISRHYHHQIYGAVIKSVNPGGQGLKTVVDALLRYEGVTRRRVEFIATDQTRKITGELNAERSKAAGAKRFEWIHSGGGAEPRRLHLQLSGRIFSYDDLPVIDERTGERGLPGQLPNCRCTARPIVDFED